jgi:putative ABC transport system permease protein
MSTAQLLKRNLVYYWRTNAAVVAGVAVAVAVLAGALIVGASVRASLRDLFVQRLGNTDLVVASSSFFRDQLADDLTKQPQFANHSFVSSAPLIALEGTIAHEKSGRRASHVRVYGVDERFWRFHGKNVRQLDNREMIIGGPLSRELDSRPGDQLLLTIQKPSDIPAESLHSRKEDLGRTLRLNQRETLPMEELGEFAVQPQQAEVRAVFLSLQLLQHEIDQPGRANLLLVSQRNRDSENNLQTQAALPELLKSAAVTEDYGLQIRALQDQQGISVEHNSKLLTDSLIEAATNAAKKMNLRVMPLMSYLANSITATENGKSIPYSLVTAVDDETWRQLKRADQDPTPIPFGMHLSGLTSIILNDWAARDLGVKKGDTVTLDYYYWHPDGRLETRSADFQLEAVIPISGLASDKDLVPSYPGITGSENLSDWDPPFPIELDRVRKQDEDYWHEFKTTPKAFISLARGQDVWQSRFGNLTSLRLHSNEGQVSAQVAETYKRSLLESLEPDRFGLAVIPVYQQGLMASRGATDFGEYFLYFSLFLVISALLLTALFFKLGIEQRLREIGLLQAIGLPDSRVRKLFLLEGLLLSVIGSLFGIVGAVAYGWLIMTGLRTWWIDAVGTSLLKLHVTPLSLIIGAVGGIVAALVCIVWTLRRVGKASTRTLLMGQSTEQMQTTSRKRRTILTRSRIATAFLTIGVLLLVATALHFVEQTVGFFFGGVLLLTSLLLYQSAWLRRGRGKVIQGNGWWSIARLGLRNATNRPGRSVLCIALIASAAFIIVSVDAFRHREGALTFDRKSGNGGFPLLAESLLPLVHDPNSKEGREALNLKSDASSPLATTTLVRFRMKPGDDASCLNLYQPRNPKIIAPPDDFIRANRFVFGNSLAATNEERDNPWLLLHRQFPDGAIPVIGDGNSLIYVLHLKPGEDFVLNRDGKTIHLRVVGALADSVFQSELLMSEANFLRLFPDQEGFRFFLIDTSKPGESAAIATALEDRLSDFGFDVASTNERLANFHRVENTYLSTFQMLGGLGLLLGTLGLAAVFLRNVLERRRELALLRAVGYKSSHLTQMAIAENALLLLAGLITGTLCALLAIGPVLFERGGRLANVSLVVLLLAVVVAGLGASLFATWATLRSPLLPALRAE